MKKVLIGGTTVVALAVVFGFVPYYLGGKAKESLQAQHRALADTFYFDVVSRDYNRGWFSSTETTVIRLHPAILSKFDKQLPDNIKLLFSKPITMINHVQHSLFANGITPVRAVVDTDLQYDPEVKKVLARFFGEQVPVTVHNVIKLDGSGELNVKMAAFDYEELSGIKLNWRGMTADVNYQKDFTRYASHFVLPGLKAQLADKGSLNVENIDIKLESHDGQNDITLGSSETHLGRFDVAWSKDIAYDIQLNDLVNMVTDLQIGAFINPTGSVAPNHVSVQNLSYQTKTDDAGSHFVNSQGVFTFEKLHYGEEEYGPLKVDISAEHIDSKALSALKQRWAQIATSDQSSETVQKVALEAVRKEGAGLFTNNPIFKINAFDFTTPKGFIKVDGTIKFNGLTASDLNDFSAMVKKTQADIGFNIAQPLVESIAITQLRSLFTVEDPNSAQEQQEISDTIRLMVNETITTMVNDGYLKKENGAVQMRIDLNDNKLTLNGKPFEMQSQEDALAQLEAQTIDAVDATEQPITPAQAASAATASVPAVAASAP